jgi:hypothetical protein
MSFSPELKAALIDVLTINGFEVPETSTARRFTARLSFPFPSIQGSVHAEIMVHSDYAYVSFWGLGVEKTRKIDYTINDIRKIDARIKRVVKVAQNIARSALVKQKVNSKRFEDTKAKVIATLGIVDVKQSEYSAAAIISVNGYTIETNDDLQVQLKVGSFNGKVDIAVAYELMKQLPEGTGDEE